VPYTWVSQAATEVTTPTNNAQVPLTSVSSNEVLRRVVVEYYVDAVVSATNELIPWMQRGLLSLVEVTSGNPPPIPDPIQATGFDTRDILYSRLDTVQGASIFNNWFRVPGNGDAGRIDVEISRRPDPDPLIVWWNWGVPGGNLGTSNIGFWRVWSRCLLETPL
jgi:hypothetical protein